MFCSAIREYKPSVIVCCLCRWHCESRDPTVLMLKQSVIIVVDRKLHRAINHRNCALSLVISLAQHRHGTQGSACGA